MNNVVYFEMCVDDPERAIEFLSIGVLVEVLSVGKVWIIVGAFTAAEGSCE